MIVLHEVSQTALAAAVLTLGLVILLELRSIVRLRRTMDAGLARVFEQLDLVRLDAQQSLEAQAHVCVAPAPVGPPAPALPAERPAAEDLAAQPPGINAYTSAATLASHGLRPEEIATRCGLPAGEARLLASMASARKRRAQSAQVEVGNAAADASVAAEPARRTAGPGKA
ncbi:MAG: DUF2802 domain-containing protein [Steroidobacterales bacterium]